MFTRLRHLSGLLLLLQASVAIAGEWQVVVHIQSPILQLNQAQVRNLFMGNTATVGLQVLDSDDPAQRADFYWHVLGLTENRWRAHWSKLVFTAQSTPPLQLNQAEVFAVLQQSTLAVAYLPLNTPLHANMKRVFIYSDPATAK